MEGELGDPCYLMMIGRDSVTDLMSQHLDRFDFLKRGYKPIEQPSTWSSAYSYPFNSYHTALQRNTKCDTRTPTKRASPTTTALVKRGETPPRTREAAQPRYGPPRVYHHTPPGIRSARPAWDNQIFHRGRSLPSYL